MATRYNPFTRKLDYVGADDQDGATTTTDPHDQADGYMAVVDGVLYFFSGSHRYKLTGTLSDPVVDLHGHPWGGLLLALTQPSPAIGGTTYGSATYGTTTYS